MSEVTRRSKVAEACEKFKSHLATRVVEELSKCSFISGVKGIDIKDKNDLLMLQAIIKNKQATPTEIDYISQKIIPHDPSATFISTYENFYHILQKYRAASKLLANIDNADAFRCTFLEYSATISKSPLDKPTADFISVVAPSLAASLKAKTADRFFAPETEETDAIEERKTRRRSKSI